MALPPSHAIELFAGGGGLALGLKLAVPSLRTVCYVEREAYAAAVLVARMEEQALDPAPVWSDVTTFDGSPWRGVVDLVAGGFPCQDVSNAGKRAGLDGARSGLWSEFARIIDEVRPRLVFIENVSALRSRGLDRVLADLAALGFDAEWDCVRASDVGAPHRRERIFVLAHDNRHELRVESGGASGRTGPVRPSLETLARLWPTTTTTDAKASGAAGYSTASGRHSGVTLTDAAVRKNWATTTTTRDGKDGACAESAAPTNALLGRQVLRTPWDGDPTSKPGRVLNPRFCEALMGWPIGWTDCGSAATESSPIKLPTPSDDCGSA